MEINNQCLTVFSRKNEVHCMKMESPVGNYEIYKKIAFFYIPCEAFDFVGA